MAGTLTAAPRPARAATHPLDNVIWQALTSHQAPLALGDALARRFKPAYAAFAARSERTPRALEALARIVSVREEVGLFEPEAVEPGDCFKVLACRELVQMVGPAAGEVARPARFAELGRRDQSQMLALVDQTQPGPFFDRTAELGRFIGLRVDGRIVAMAGERLHLEGYREISGICTDVAWRGRGLARDLVLLASQAIVERGEVPFLHVLADNATAIALYERLGFVRRMTGQVTLLRRTDVPAA